MIGHRQPAPPVLAFDTVYVLRAGTSWHPCPSQPGHYYIGCCEVIIYRRGCAASLLRPARLGSFLAPEGLVLPAVWPEDLPMFQIYTLSGATSMCDYEYGMSSIIVSAIMGQYTDLWAADRGHRLSSSSCFLAVNVYMLASPAMDSS
eukprot:scaffold8939_cov45-Prasinocladus_malaysianus.AAC.1